ncbi:uncharacterized protein LOC130135074 isoform X1 [Syzygium oleosum]|uniref:uncharacterized protein LOC130135074 isoform X1 n=1 Tax=Syzygium oleosum TaxID=219896 RepID=UPI0024BABEDB|nr:uncharacterized protein LOC130135074 isoform X1 [Syzygium oleosum]
MVVIASKRMGLMMVVATLILCSSIGADADAHILLSRKWRCVMLCALTPPIIPCVLKCLIYPPTQSLTSAASQHCDVGCFLSTCLDYHQDSEKVAMDVNKAGACADSCSRSCQKTYPLH